jgi:hypothetical protein
LSLAASSSGVRVGEGPRLVTDSTRGALVAAFKDLWWKAIRIALMAADALPVEQAQQAPGAGQTKSPVSSGNDGDKKARFYWRGYTHLKIWAGKPLYSVVITFAGFFTGFFGSLHSSDIRAVLPFVWPSAAHSVTNGYAIVFWFLALFWLLLFFVRQQVEGESASRLSAQAKEIVLQTEKIRIHNEIIREAVLTLPPATFIREFCRHVMGIHTVVFSHLPRHGQLTQRELEELIRRLLNVVATLAYSYDAREARYAANVMVFIARENDCTSYFPGIDNDKIRRFLPRQYGLEFLEGVLVLPKVLSAVATMRSGEDVTIDTDLVEVIFGIPKQHREGSLWTVLPGAPLAFTKWNDTEEKENFRDAVQGFDDIRDFRRLAKEGVGSEGFSLRPEVIKAVEDFYSASASGQSIRSFQALPLLEASASRRAFGVLNVHCDQQVFLGPQSPHEALQRQQIFAGIISPIVFELAALVKMWFKIVTTNEAIRDQVFGARA